MRDLVSVIVPAYNARRHLPEALASVRGQQVAPLEVLVVDDGSTDGTAALARALAPAARVIEQANAGPAAARNTGLLHARGERIAFLDADDVWPAGALAALGACLDALPAVDVALGRVQLLLPSGQRLPPRRTVQLGAGLFRRAAFARAGRFDDLLRSSEDVDWYLRARDAGLHIELLDEVTLLYRQHEASLTYGRAPADLLLGRVLKRAIDRRRARER